MQATLDRGEEILLDIRDSARRRVICGLRWDPMGQPADPAAGVASKGGNTGAHDLDLLCILFDKYGNFIDGVTGEEGHRTGDSGNIYHTGDVVDGADLLDDEQISLELFNLSGKIDQIFFIAEVQSVHNFGDVANPEIRLANAIDDRNFSMAPIGGANGAESNSYVFGRIKRCSQGWVFKFIDEYFEGEHVTDWAKTLQPFIDAAKPPKGPAGRSSAPGKGQTVGLSYSTEARQRVICGLNWDPAPEGDPYDLDLACVIFNQDKEPVDGVSAKPDEVIDESGKIYHSGDDTSGEGDRTDDESISVELKDLPDYIHHIVFLVEIQSGHSFADIFNPSMRMADGKTNEDQLSVSLSNPDGSGKNAYIFARISRRGESWSLTYIDEYANGNEIEDWIGYLQRYLG